MNSRPPHSSLTTSAICHDMFFPVSFRALAMIRMVINVLLHPSSQTYFGLAWFLFRLSYPPVWVGIKPARSFTINSMIDTLDSFLLLHCGLAGTHLLSEPKQQLILCVICSLGLDISLVLIIRSWFLQHDSFLGFICDSVRQAFVIPKTSLSLRHRVDIHTDRLVLKCALKNDGCRNASVNNVLKDIFDCCREFNFSLDVHYVPSSQDPADFPSRKVSDMDCVLSKRAWEH